MTVKEAISTLTKRVAVLEKELALIQSARADGLRLERAKAAPKAEPKREVKDSE